MYATSRSEFISPGGVIISTQIVIVGAGPYGLSIAAHLAARGIDHRVFGPPMETWRNRMPAGMDLKSDGFASSLSAPVPDSTLGAFCVAKGLAYADMARPVPLTTFVRYALDFQARFAPDLDTRLVTGVEPETSGFRVTLQDGETLAARQVVVAAGITHFSHTPEALQGLPRDLISHSSDHADPSVLAGRDVAVIGGGSSAVDLAALMSEAGVRARLVARNSTLKFFSEQTDQRPSLLQQLRRPHSGLGPGWMSRLCSDLPHLFRLLPSRTRLEVVRRHLGPASAWGLQQRIADQVPTLLGHHVQGADVTGGKVRLHLLGPDGEAATLLADHVVAATGYLPDLRRLPFLATGLRERIRALGHAPNLSAFFESSIPGLFFAGPAAASTFGPLMRFMFGADFAARRLARRLASSPR